MGHWVASSITAIWLEKVLGKSGQSNDNEIEK